MKFNLVPPVLIKLIKNLLLKMIEDSKVTANDISKRIDNMSSVDDAQRKSLQEFMEKFYFNDASNGLKDTLNDNIDDMFEAIQKGDMDVVNKITSSSEYDKARKDTKEFHDSLQQMIHGDTNLTEELMLMFTTLESYNRTRQEVEGLIKLLDEYLKTASVQVENTDLASHLTDDFWKKLSHHFVDMESKTFVLKTIFGAEYVLDRK